MRTILNKITTLSIVLLIVIPLVSFNQSHRKTNYSIENKPVRILFKADTLYVTNKFKTLNINQIKSEKLRNIFQIFGIKEIKPVLKNRYDLNGQLKYKFSKNNEKECWFIISCEQKDTYSFINKLKTSNEIIKANIEKSIIVPCKTSYDFSFGDKQWFLTRAQGINVEDAWTINKGRSDVIIAVCDGGVDYTHPNLDPGDRSRVIAGYDFGSDDNNPMDDLPEASSESFANHGTHIAGIIGANPTSTNNISGIMQNCKIMPVKMVGSGGIKWPFTDVYAWDFSTTAFPSDVADAIDYAVNNGANVINLSFGFTLPNIPLADAISGLDVMVTAINNAYNQNVVIVVAMGNEGENGSPIQYPAVLSHVIAVGNTNSLRQRSPSSSIGSHICVSAPGTDILSTIRGGGIDYKSGTSMSAPVVSGLSGLIISQGKDRGFNLTNDDVRHILEKTADDVLPIGFDNETGFGIVNAYSALQLLSLPNNLIHGIAIGGTSNKLTTLNQWILSSPCQSLAAGAYLNVDQYEITKHITFDTPYMSTPVVWLRDRESLSLSFANPNDGRPFVSITNITNTGFDIRYATYYVRYNSIGQTLNKWIPETLSSTKIAYTVVGIPAPTLSGPSQICSQGTYTINNLPAGATVAWSATPANIISYSPTGNPITVTKTGNGKITLTATINSNFTLQMPVSIGAPYSLGISGISNLNMVDANDFQVLPGRGYYAYEGVLSVSDGVGLAAGYSWSLYSSTAGKFVSWSSNGGSVDVAMKTTNTELILLCTTSNSCGSYTNYYLFSTGTILPLILTPNPSSTQVEVSVGDEDTYTAGTLQPLSTEIADNISYSISVVDSYGYTVYSTTKTGKKFTISTSSFRNGIYAVIVSDGKNVYQKKLIVNH